jgi:hypothetical protein
VRGKGHAVNITTPSKPPAQPPGKAIAGNRRAFELKGKINSVQDRKLKYAGFVESSTVIESLDDFDSSATNTAGSPGSVPS